MIVCIQSTKNSILVIVTISFFLCVRIPSITCTDPQTQNSVPSRTESTEENNQTTSIDQTSSQSNDNTLSELTLEIPLTDNSSTIVNDALPGSNETKSDTIEEISRPTTSPLAVDNQTNDEQAHSTSSPTKRNLSSINSFEEWKQQQLQADLIRKGETASHNNAPSEASSISSPPTNTPQGTASMGSSKKGKLRKNFASASCGAKLLAHNTEAQNVASILSSSPDEYMLNPCNAKIWFVIELCESIRILNIEIANFELFSSVPKTFRVSASDRYPTKDWNRHHLGTFNASFQRTIQSFQTKQSTVYIKYVKFELLDFHGHEHYCPLSVVRIHGSNVEDEIMIMEENTNNLMDSKPLSDDLMENDDDGEEDNASNDQQVGGIIGSAILDLAKRVFRRPTTARGTTSTAPMPTKETNILKTNCHQTVLNGSVLNESINSWRHTDTFKQCIADYIRGLWSNLDTCTIYLSHNCFKINYCCQCPLITHNTKTNKIISTLNIYTNPCGYYHILTNQFVCNKEKSIPFNETLPDINLDLNQNWTDKHPIDEKDDKITVSNESTDISGDKSPVKVNNISLNETSINFLQNRTSEQSLVNNISNEELLVFESQLLSNATNQSNIQSEPINLSNNITEQEIDINTIDEIVTSTLATTILSPVSPTANNNEAVPSVLSNTWLKGMLLNTKSLPELYKIIEKLNFNLTLSNRYLQELSQHYVKKLDETQQTTDLLLKASKAADQKLENFHEYLSKLDQDFNQMSSRLITLEAWIPVIILLILCLFICSTFSTCYLVRTRRKLKNIMIEFNKIQGNKHSVASDDHDETTEDYPFMCNGIKKRKLSTDSNDSNLSRSQRVPDSSLTKIKENGIHHHENKIKKRSPKQTQNLLPLTTMNN